MQEFLGSIDFNSLIITVINVVLIPMICRVIKAAVTYFNTKAASLESEKTRSFLQSALSEVDYAATAAVNRIAQTYVSALKANGSFNADEQKIALNKAYDVIIDIMSNDTIEFLNAQLTSDGFHELLVSKIESLVISNKGGAQ